MHDITISNLRGLIRNLKIKSAPDTDKIPNIALKHLPKRPLIHLLNIYKYCIKFNYFPQIWKNVKIIMLPKPGKDPTIPDNLRSVSPLPTLSKILEKLILQNLRTEIFDKQIIPDYQFGFRKPHSTSLQLARLIDLIITGFNKKNSTDAVVLYIEKALDTTWISGFIYRVIQNKRTKIKQNIGMPH